MRVNNFSAIGDSDAWANQKKNEFFFVFLSVCTTFVGKKRDEQRTYS